MQVIVIIHKITGFFEPYPRVTKLGRAQRRLTQHVYEAAAIDSDQSPMKNPVHPMFLRNLRKPDLRSKFFPGAWEGKLKEEEELAHSFTHIRLLVYSFSDKAKA
ncbi:unnamed protein product [Merluccius merluccius]